VKRFFTPRLRFKSLDELKRLGWLINAIAYAKAHRHPELTEQTVWEVFEAERPKARFPMLAGSTASTRCQHRSRRPVWCASTTINTRWQRARSDGPVEVHGPMPTAFAIRQDGRIVAEHPRSFGRGETTYDPWHYVPVLARKPGALRNGAPFKGLGVAGGDGTCTGASSPVPTTAIDKWSTSSNAVLTDGLPAVEACLRRGNRPRRPFCRCRFSNILARQRDPAPASQHRHTGLR